MALHSQSFLLTSSSPSSPVIGDNNGGGDKSIESLNQLMDPVSFLTESDMQQDLDFFANAQFSYDIPPTAALYGPEKWPTSTVTTPCEEQKSFFDEHQASPEEQFMFEQLDDAVEPSTSTSSSTNNTHSRPQKLSRDEKRKRNTAASARFRVKKKMREQALQRTALEMTEKSNRLEAHIKDLEREIKWLKALVMEKNEGRLAELVQQRPPVMCPHHQHHQ